MSERTTEFDHIANGHRWPCPGFYTGNHDPIRAGAWSCTCGGVRTPQEWCGELGARVLDRDGWRDGTRSWDVPITREEFDRRLARCTIDMRGYPSFIVAPCLPSLGESCGHCHRCTDVATPPGSTTDSEADR